MARRLGSRVGLRRRRRRIVGRQVARAEHVDGQAQAHPDARGAEADVPAVELAQGAAHQRREEGPEVDAHVVEVVGTGQARIVGGVQRPHLAGQVGQEQAVAAGDRHHRGIEQRLRRHHEMAAGHQQAADDDRAPPAEPAIRDHAADDGRQVHAGRIRAVHQRGAGLVVVQLLDHVVDLQRAHAEEGELLPHLRQEQDRQARRLAEPGAGGGARHARLRVAAGSVRRIAQYPAPKPMRW